MYNRMNKMLWEPNIVLVRAAYVRIVFVRLSGDIALLSSLLAANIGVLIKIKYLPARDAGHRRYVGGD